MFWASSFVFDTVEEVDDSVSTMSELISEFSVDAKSALGQSQIYLQNRSSLSSSMFSLSNTISLRSVTGQAGLCLPSVSRRFPIISIGI
jgi:hypothetical protein